MSIKNWKVLSEIQHPLSDLASLKNYVIMCRNRWSVANLSASLFTFVFMNLVSVHSLTFSCKTENKRFLHIRWSEFSWTSVRWTVCHHYNWTITVLWMHRSQTTKDNIFIWKIYTHVKILFISAISYENVFYFCSII